MNHLPFLPAKDLSEGSSIDFTLPPASPPPCERSSRRGRAAAQPCDSHAAGASRARSPRGATVFYDLPAAGHVKLDLFDASGKLVRTLVDAPKSKGSHSVRWRGTNAAGERMRPGIYFCRLTSVDETVTYKLVMLG